MNRNAVSGWKSGRRGVLILTLLAILLSPIAIQGHAGAPITEPEISIIIPSSHTIGNYTYIHGLVDVDVNITGNFTYADFYLDNALISQIVPENLTYTQNGTIYTYTTYHYFWNTFYTGEGEHFVKVVAFYQNTSTSLSRTYYVDNHKPIGEVTAQNHGIMKGTENLTISLDDPFFSIASGLRNFTLFIDGKEVYSHNFTTQILTYTTNYSWDTTLYRDGYHNVSVEVIDNAGNVGNYSFRFLVDNHPPSVAIISSIYLKGIAAINVSTSDNVSGIGKVEFFIDSNLTYTAYKYPYVFIWNTTQYKDGRHLITVRVWDRAGNNNSASVYVIVDNTPPIISILSPKNTNISGVVNLTIQGQDAITGMAYMKLYIDNYLISQGINSVSYEWNTTKYKNGYHRVSIVASDTIGNVEIKTFEFYIYNKPHPPTLTITSPRNNTITGNNLVIVKWKSTGQLQYYEVKVDNTQYIQIKNATYQVSLSDGKHTIYVRAVFKGNYIITKEVVVRIDTTPPDILGLLPQYHFTKPGEVNFTIKDASPFIVWIFVAQEEQWILYNQGNQTNWTIPINKLGDYQFKIVSKDVVGNVQVRTIEVKYELPAPQKATHHKTSMLQMTAIPLVLMLVAIAAIVVIARKRKGAKKEEKRVLTPKERAILDGILEYLDENEGAKRGDVVKDVATRLGMSESEVAVMLDYAKENFIVNEKVGEDGAIRVYPLEKTENSEQVENVPSEEKKKISLFKRRG